MAAPKKFTVVKLLEPSELGKNSYKIVPTSWIVPKEDSDYVNVLYPPEDQLSSAFGRIFNCQLPLAQWDDYLAIVECEADTYDAGMLYIKRKDPTPLDEETLMVWKLTIGEFMEEFGRLHPVTIIHQLWTRLRNLIRQ